MVENKIIFKNKEVSKIDSRVLGVSGENKQQILVFKIDEGFIDGTAFLELILPTDNCCNNKKHSIELEKDVENECYQLEVKRSLLRYDGDVKMQLKIISNGVEVYKTAIFDMHVMEAINAVESIEEDYPCFVEQTKVELQELQEGLEQVCEDLGKIEVPTKISELENDIFEEISDFEVDKMFSPRTFCRVNLENASVVSSTNDADGEYFLRGTEITVKADKAQEGYVVDYLEVTDKNNHIKYSASQYTFWLEEDVTIKAVYAKEGEVSEPFLSVTLQHGASVYGSHGDTIFLVAGRNTFNPYVVDEWGILRTFGDEELTLENANVNGNIAKRAAKRTDVRFRNILPTSLISEYVGINAIMRAVAYVNLTKDGVTETIYSNEISVDIDGEIAILNELR